MKKWLKLYKNFKNKNFKKLKVYWICLTRLIKIYNH